MKTKTLHADVCFFSAALDSVQTNIFIADRDFNLIYVNPKAEQTLKIIEDEIFRAFGVRVDNFIGKSIHCFHKDPNQVEKFLQNSSALPHEAFFDFGAVRLKTSINGVAGPEGEITGYIVNWEDVSEKVRKNEEMIKRIKELDNIDNESL